MKFFASPLSIVGAASFFAALAPAHAGQYTQDFNSFFLGQTDLGGAGTLTSSIPGGVVAHIEDGALKELQLSQHDVADSRSAFLLPDLDPGARLYSFSASWVSPVYGNFPNAGEGFSFSFGPVRPLNLITGSVESGYGVGLCLSVKTGSNGPGFYLLKNGTVIASSTNNPTAVWGNFSGTRHAFQVDWDNDTGLTVRRNGAAIFTNVPTDGFTPVAGDSFVWAARGGDVSQTWRMDNVSLTTVTQAAPTVRAVWGKGSLLPTVTVLADVNTRGLETTVQFEFGPTTAYGSSASQTLPAGSGLSAGVSKSFAFDTDRQIPLHARVTATNALGSVTSSDAIFLPGPFERRLGKGAVFVPVSGQGISAGVWLDMDDDGDLDFANAGGGLGSGPAFGIVYRNSGSATNWPFTGMTETLHSSITVGDFDNDNRPDSLWAGGRYLVLPVPTPGNLAFIAYGVPTNLLNQYGKAAQAFQFPFWLDSSRGMTGSPHASKISRTAANNRSSATTW